MAKKQIGLYREYIIHPGETLLEMLEDRSMSQKELALRTGVSEKHISKVINGQAPISASFARNLEIALGVESIFWQNLQNNYDVDLLKFEELHSISEEEHNIVKKLKKEVIQWIEVNNFFKFSDDIDSLILDLREFFKVVNLSNMNKLAFSGAYRANSNISYDNDIIYSLEFICQLLTQNTEVVTNLTFDEQKEKLLLCIPKIKSLMNLEPSEFEPELKNIFASCGIAFAIAPKFKNAPVQGLIKRINDKYIMCLTYRQKRADIFWFTLFHEIGHFIHGDAEKGYLDFESIATGTKEILADRFSANTLINKKEFDNFIKTANYQSIEEINKFAKQQNVISSIVIGRLQKEKLLKWSTLNEYILKY